jgi:hypothetical protein
MRDRLSDLVAARHGDRGAPEGRAAGEVAASVLALDAGLFLQQLIDPDAITADFRARAITAVIDGSAGGGDG